MAQKNSVKPLLLTTVNTAGISAITWVPFSTGIEGECFFFRITNDSDTDVFISFDSANRHEFLSSGDTIEINFQTNSSPSNYVSKVRLGTIISVQGVAGTGLVYLAGYYNEKF